MPSGEENTCQSRGAFFPDNERILFGSWQYAAVAAWKSGGGIAHFAVDGLHLPDGRLSPLKDLGFNSFQQVAPKYRQNWEMIGQLVDVDVSSDGQWVAYGASHRGFGTCEVIDLQSASRWTGNIPGLHQIRFRPQFPHVILAGSHGEKSVEVRQRSNGALIDRWSDEQPEVDRGQWTGANGWTALMESLTMTADGRRLFLVQTDGSIRMLELTAEGKFRRSLRLIPMDAADWCAILPDGHYTGSPAGIAGVRILERGVARPLTHFDLTYNRPDEVLDALGAPVSTVNQLHALVEKRALRQSATAAPVDGPSPRVQLRGVSPMPVQTDRETLPMEIECLPAKAPLQRFNVLVNGVPWPDSHGVVFESPRATRLTKTVNLPLSHGVNRIQVSATDNAGHDSPESVLQITRTGARQRNVWLLAVGVAKYANSDFNLKFAASDARVIEKLASRWVDGGGTLHAQVVTDADATREKILAAASAFHESHADDLVVIFMSGHGALDGAKQDQWHFCPHDHDFSDHAKRGISYTEMAALFDGIGARQRLLLLDSCHSGEIEDGDNRGGGPRINARGVSIRKSGPENISGTAPSARERVFTLQDIFADFRTGAGAAVIGASAASQFALESPELRQGVFTHSLAEGLQSGAADLDHDGRITTSELHRYLAERVLSYTEGSQQPSSRGINPESDFVLLESPRTRRAPKIPPTPATASASPSPKGDAVLLGSVPGKTMDSFVRRFLVAGASDQAGGVPQSSYFAPQIIRYFNMKSPTLEKVRADIAGYEARWPIRYYSILNLSSVEAGDGSQKFTVRLRYYAARSLTDPKPRAGEITNVVLAREQGGQFFIYGVWSE